MESFLLPSTNQDISLPLFIQGYMVIMEGEERAIKGRMASHLKELKSGAELYGWDRTRAFHGIWLNKLEQGRCTWHNETEKLSFLHALGWHLALSSRPLCHLHCLAYGKQETAQAPSQVQWPTQTRH